MDLIRQQVLQARRRLTTELFLRRLAIGLFVALGCAAIAIAAPKLVAIENLPAAWAAWCLGVATAAGIVIAAVWAWASRQSDVDAAMEIDRRFGLKERIASSLSLPPEMAASPTGQALIHDAERAARRLDIGERFRIRVGREAWLPLAPVAIALVLMLFVSNEQAQSRLNPTVSLTPKALESSTQTLRKRLAEIKKQTPKKNLKDAEALLLELDKQLERIAKQGSGDRKQTLAKFNNLARQLAERRQRVGGDEELKRQLSAMKDLGRGPGEKMAAALKSGDWDQARQELQKLQQQLASGKLDAKAQKQLGEQMKNLESQLAEASAKREQAIDALKKQVAEQKQKGDLAKAGELQEKLEKMMRQQQGAEQLQQLAQQLATAREKMKQGDPKAAGEAMAQMMQQLEQMQQQMDMDASEGQMLDMAMDQLEMTRDSLACENCQGEGCAECRSQMAGNNRSGMGGGRGIGSGRGFGQRPQDGLNAGFRDTRVRQNPSRGPAVITGEAEGPTIRGDVREVIKGEVEAGEVAEADAIVIEQLPRAQRENARDYFERAGLLR